MADVYEVTSQREERDVGPSGMLEQFYEVAFKSKPSNTIATVRIPASMYTPPEVDQLIRAKVAAIEAVAAL